NADPKRVAIGGMSAGGMVTCSRLCRPHLFAAAALESTSGNWSELPMLDVVDAQAAERIAESDPMHHLNHWRPLPLIAIHARLDTWVPFAGQWRFLDALEALGPPSLITRVAYERTGAPGEHAGFGTMSSDAKDRHADFLAQQLLQQTP
ncbi:MAG: prolyl oligopeptidase family serine peptidase, partial [Phycisphaerae bacterium]|nr:prolyl oligopeptidase family serine peptidase [Phycisphaerae bacterium]